MKRLKLLVFLLLLPTFILPQTTQYPYPIIFVHGISGSEETFIETMQYFESNFGWGPINVYDVVLNADDDDGSSVLNADVKWDDFYFNGDLIKVGRRNYNPDPDLCIDGWVDNNSRLYAINFMEERIRGAYGLLNDHFDHSNEAAIYKQAAALRQIIIEVLNFTGAEKVILVGHSMGGLAIREYLQRTNTGLPGGEHTWWIDQSESGHKVAKVVTIGTPHYGFDRIYSPLKMSGNIESNVFPPHFGSEAMRDMSIEVENFWTQNFNAPYLFSGSESDVYQNVLSNINFFNKDINCDGTDTNYIVGLNTSNIQPINKSDNPSIPLPPKIDYTWIVGHDASGLDDGVVTTSRQFLENKGDSIKAFINVGILLYAHLYEGAAYNAIIRGLDEPKTSDLAYVLTSTNPSYFVRSVQGFITYQTNYAVKDTDYYKFTIDIDGSLVLNCSNINFNNGMMTLLDGSLTQIASDTLPSTITQTVTSGDYYIRIVGDATSTSWENPYNLSINVNNPDPYEPNGSFVESTPIEVGMEIQSHTIYPSGDVDYLKFNVIQGYGYTIRLDEETGVDVRCAVYRNDQSQIAGLITEEYNYVSTETGINYIQVYRNAGTTTGNYTIRVLPAYWNGDSQIVYDNYYEPNPNSYCAYSLQTNGVNHFNLIHTGDEDWFRITGSQGNTYTAILSEENAADVRMAIYFENADHSLTEIAGLITTQYQWTCAQTGSYMIYVYRNGGLSEGDYKIRVNSASQTYEVNVYPTTVFMYPGDNPYKLNASSSNSTGITWSSLNEAIATVDQNGNVTPVGVGNVKIRATSNNPPNQFDEAIVYVAPIGNYEPNGSFVESTPIEVGMEIQSHTIYPSGDVDYLKFNVIQGYGYTIRLDEETGVDVRCAVYRNDQSQIAGLITEEYNYVSTETGINYIQVYRNAGTTTGNYTIRVLPAYWNGDSQIVYDNYYEPNPNSYCAYSLQTNGVNHFNLIHTGDEDWFRITGSQGNTYTAILSEENAADVRMAIYFENADHSLTEIAGLITTQYQWTCAQTGSYMIYVYRNGGLSEGDYKIRVNSASQTYEVNVYPTTVFMYPGDNPYKLNASSSNSTGITWSSLNEAIATVDQNGNVTPVGVGNVKIRATSNNPPNQFDEAIVYVAPIGNYEPNGSFVESTPIEVGMEIQSHTIYPSGDVDYLKFNVIQGYGYTIRLDEETGVDVRCAVYRNDQSQIAGLITEEYNYVSTETGINYIQVYRNAGTTTGNYTIRVLPAYWNGDSQIVYDNYYEPNPNSYCAYSLQTNGVNHFNLIHTGDEDWFRITGSQGNTYTAILSEENAADVRMAIYFENADHSLTEIAGLITTQYQWTCAQTGSYMIYVYRNGGLSEGDYKIRVNSASQTYEVNVYPTTVFMYPGDNPYKLNASSSNSTGITWSSLNEAIATVDQNGNVTPVGVGNVKIRATSNNPPNQFDEAIVYVAPIGNYEPNGSFVESTPIEVGMEIQSHTIYPSGDVDYLKFNVIQGYGYTIRLDEETGVDVRCAVYRNDQSQIAGLITEEYNYVSTETGINYIQVYRNAGTTTGNYTIRVLPAYWNGDSQIVYDNYYEPNPNSYCAYSLQTNGVNHFNLIHTGDEDWFRITGSQGNTYTAILSEENAADVRMAIYFENADHSLTEIAGLITTQYQWTCAQTGSYMIYVYRNGGLSEGDYKIRINFDNQPTTFTLSVLINNGWNMVSTPGLHPTNQNVTTWWSGKDPAAGVFRFSGGYLPVTTTIPGQGYWMKHLGKAITHITSRQEFRL